MKTTTKSFLVWALISGFMGFLLMKGCSNSDNGAKEFNKSAKKGKSLQAVAANDSLKPFEQVKQASVEPTPLVEPEKVDSWRYSSDIDPMDSTVSKFANITSENAFQFSFPYGEAHSGLMVRKRAKDGLKVLFFVSSGQIVCHSSCTVKVRFDDNPAKTFTATTPADYDSKTLFLSPASKFVSELKKAKTTLVEVTYYSSGNRISEFKTEGFKWE